MESGQTSIKREGYSRYGLASCTVSLVALCFIMGSEWMSALAETKSGLEKAEGLIICSLISYVVCATLWVLGLLDKVRNRSLVYLSISITSYFIVLLFFPAKLGRRHHIIDRYFIENVYELSVREAVVLGKAQRVTKKIKGININWRDKRGKTYLMLAAANGYVDIVRILLEHGADIGLKASDGQTAVNFARVNKHYDVIRLLEQGH